MLPACGPGMKGGSRAGVIAAGVIPLAGLSDMIGTLMALVGVDAALRGCSQKGAPVTTIVRQV